MLDSLNFIYDCFYCNDQPRKVVKTSNPYIYMTPYEVHYMAKWKPLCGLVSSANLHFNVCFYYSS